MSGGGGLQRSGGGSLHFSDDDEKYDYLFKVGCTEHCTVCREVWGMEKIHRKLSGQPVPLQQASLLAVVFNCFVWVSCES